MAESGGHRPRVDRRSRRCRPGRPGRRAQRERKGAAAAGYRRAGVGVESGRRRGGARVGVDGRGRGDHDSGGVARRATRVGAGPDLGAVRPAIAVGVGDPRVRAEALLGPVGESVVIGALAPVADPVVVGVGPARARPSPELERGGETVVVGVLPAVPDPVAVAVCASRVHPGEVFLPVGQAVAIRVLAPVGDPVAVGVHPIGAGPRPGPFPGVRQAVVVRVGGSRDDRRREQARDQQHGGGNQPRTAIRATIHAPIVPGDCGRECSSGSPRKGPWCSGWQRPRLNLPGGATICSWKRARPRRTAHADEAGRTGARGDDVAFTELVDPGPGRCAIAHPFAITASKDPPAGEPAPDPDRPPPPREPPARPGPLRPMAPSAPRQCLLRGAAPASALEHPHQDPAGRRTGRTRSHGLGRRPGRPGPRLWTADAGTPRSSSCTTTPGIPWPRSPTSSGSGRHGEVPAALTPR